MPRRMLRPPSPVSVSSWFDPVRFSMLEDRATHRR